MREAILRRRHDDEIESDASEMIWAIFGTAVHSILESAEETDSQLKENKLEVEMPNGYTLSGVFDLYDDETGTVTDYKTASCWKVAFDDWKDYRDQVLIYCWMLRQIGFDAKRGQIVAMLKDHSKSKAKRGEQPPLPVYQIGWDFDDEDFAKIEEYLIGKFAQIEEAEKLPDHMLPMCSEEDRWTRGEEWAVLKRGNKRAKKVFRPGTYENPEKAAEEYAHELGTGFMVEHRPGLDAKCMDYCSAAPFCNYWRNKYGEA